MTGEKVTKDYADAVRLYEKGLSLQQIATTYGVTRQSMWQALTRRGVVMRSHIRSGSNNPFYREGARADAHAQNVLEYALRRGVVTRPTICQHCGASPTFRDGRTAIQAHHPDYRKPLEVMWLCQPCHHQWHRHHRAIPAEGG